MQRENESYSNKFNEDKSSEQSRVAQEALRRHGDFPSTSQGEVVKNRASTVTNDAREHTRGEEHDNDYQLGNAKKAGAVKSSSADGEGEMSAGEAIHEAGQAAKAPVQAVYSALGGRRQRFQESSGAGVRSGRCQ